MCAPGGCEHVTAATLEPGDTLAPTLTGGPGRRIRDVDMVGTAGNPADPVMVLVTLEPVDGSDAYRPVELDPAATVRILRRRCDYAGCRSLAQGDGRPFCVAHHDTDEGVKP